MSYSDTHKTTILKCLKIIIILVILIILFFASLIFLSDLSDIILIFIVSAIGVAFIFMGARLLVTISQLYDKTLDIDIKASDGLLKRHASKIVSAKELKNILLKNGYSLVNTTNTLNQTDVKYFSLQRIRSNKGTYIDDFYIIDIDESISDLNKIIEKINTILHNCKNDVKERIIRQKCVFVCVICNDMSECDIKKIVSGFNYVYAIYIPIVISRKNKEIFHHEIPLNIHLAKGKALVYAQNIIVTYLYN